MAWSKEQSSVPADLSPVDILKKESNYASAYPELQPWIDSLRDCRYNLTGEYDIDENNTLYRYELDEEFREGLTKGSSHFVNVTISRKAKPAELGTAQLVEKCPTCCKPI